MSADGEFAGRVIMITGSARGQGAAAARALHAAGATVLIGDILEDLGSAFASELGERSHYLRLDVTQEQSWREAITGAARLGGLHGLLNNAGIYRNASLLETDLSLWRQHIDVNQLGCFLGMREAVPLIRRSGGGSIVNVASVAGLRGSVNAFAYCATKWALRGMSRAAARELAAEQIRVNCILPGLIDTEMLGFWSEEENRTRVAAVPMGRKGRADEVADVAMFLLSGRSAYLTGAEITVDGGLSA